MVPDEKAQSHRLVHQRELNHSIPDVVIENIRSLSRVRYKQTLSAFALAYHDREFHEITEEFQLIKEFELRLLQECLGTSLSTEMNRIMRAEQLTNKVYEKYRDHYIHAFQDFLIGIIVIDRFYDQFSKWYSQTLNQNLDTCLETAWLLTTIFHDSYRPLVTITRYLEEEERFHFGNEADNAQCASDMVSVYRHLADGKSLESWAASSNGALAVHPLRGIILKHLKTHNHAILGAFLLLEQRSHLASILPPVVLNSALAIALHNREPREDLLREHIFPIPMESFPLPCLLLYVDAVQEWNRTRDSSDELVDIRFGVNSVTFIMHFGSPRAMRAKAEEFESVDKCLQNIPIKLGFGSTIFVGARSQSN